MRKNGNYNFIRDIRQNAIECLYSQMRASGDFPNLHAICVELESMPMPLHYISYRMARSLYTSYFDRGDLHTRKWPTKKRLYDSFIKECKKLRASGRYTSDRDIITNALLSPAPCIGLSESMIRRILVSMGAH